MPPSDRPSSSAPRSAGTRSAGAGTGRVTHRRAGSLGPLTGPAGSGRARRRGRWVRWVLPLLVAAVGGLVAGVTVAAAIHMPEVEAMTDFTPGLITVLYDREGEPFGTFARQRRVLLAEDEIPPILRQALVAVEDSGFYRHGGIDLLAVFRAEIANLRAGEIVEGAGTLTMQLARSLFLTREQTWRRKIEEAFLAVELEKRYSKDQILTMYMNLVNMGHGNYGMASAARYYFDKDVAALDLDEAATLAAILWAPSRLSPYRRPDLVVERRDKVLRRMLDEGIIDRRRYEEAIAEPLRVVSHLDETPLAPYYAEDVRKYLEAKYGTDEVHEGGLQVWTALDREIQEAAEEAVHAGVRRLDHRRGWRGAVAQIEGNPATHQLAEWSGEPLVAGRWYKGIVVEAGSQTATVRIQDQTFTLDREGIGWTRRRSPSDLLSSGDVAWFRVEPATGDGGESGDGEAGEDGAAASAGPGTTVALEQQPEIQGAAVVLESATGAVRAMVGGWDFERNKFNRVTQAERQVGSAFKPFVYGAALETGYTPADTIFDGPTGFRGADGRISYFPRNYTRRFYGVITLRYALEHSINVPAVKLQDMVGTRRVIDFAHRAGIDAKLPPYPSLALGAAEIRPIQLAAAYAAIANQGTWVEPHLIERVATAGGRLLERHRPVTRTTTDPRVAFVLTHMLEGVVDRGTAASIRDLPIAIAGKTGTTDDFTDAWFVGFTPRHTILVWVGYDVKRSLGRGMTGAEAALPIWRDLVESGLEDGWLREGEDFAPPPGVVTQAVEYRSGLLPGGTGRVVEEAFVQGTEPVQQASGETALIQNLPWYQQRAFYLPKEGENMRAADDPEAGGIDAAPEDAGEIPPEGGEPAPPEVEASPGAEPRPADPGDRAVAPP